MQQAIGDVCLPSRTWNSCINLVLLLWVTTRRLECKQAAVLAQVAFSVKLTPIFFFFSPGGNSRNVQGAEESTTAAMV